MDFKKIKNKKGITLIALAVTIVVLLILSGVTISSIFSENGIIKKAQQAQETINKAQENDLTELKKLETDLEKYTNLNDMAGVDFSEYIVFDFQSYIGRYSRQKCNYMQMYVEISDVENPNDKIKYAIGTDWKENIVKENDDTTKLFIKDNSKLEMVRVKSNDAKYSAENSTMSIQLVNGFTDVKISNLYLKKGRNYNIRINIKGVEAGQGELKERFFDIYNSETGILQENTTLKLEKNEVSNLKLMFDLYNNNDVNGTDAGIFSSFAIQRSISDEIILYTMSGSGNDGTYEQTCLVLMDDNGNLINEEASKYIGFDFNRDGGIDRNDLKLLYAYTNNVNGEY